MINAIAIDDEPLALKIIQEYSQKIPEMNLVSVYTDPVKSIELIKSDTIDLIFLDIQMPELKGFELMELIDCRSKVILTTAFENYALKSYDFNVTDYLLKPFTFQRFLKSVNKVIELKNENRTKNKTIFVNLGNEYFALDLDEIEYVMGQGDYIEIYFQGRKLLIRENLGNLESKYNNLIRIHRSYVININQIERIKTNEVKMKNDKYLPIGKKYKKDLITKIRSDSLG